MRKKRALKNLFFSLILQFISILSGFIGPKLIINTYGSTINGLIVSISQFLSYISLLEVGIGPVIKSQLYKPIAENDKEKIQGILKTSEIFFKRIACFFVLYLIALFILYPLFVKSDYSNIFIISLILIIAISTFFEYFFGITYMLFLQAKQISYVTSILSIISKIVNLILLYILVRLDCNILFVRFISSVVFLIKPLIQNYYVKKKFNISTRNITPVLIENKLSGLGQHVAHIIHQNTDVVILSIFSNIVNVSIYSVYNLVISSLNNLSNIIIGSTEAGLGDMYAKKEYDNLKKTFNDMEFLYISFVTIMYSSALSLVLSFVQIYTKNVEDVNYIVPTFAYIIVGAGYISSIQKLYSGLVFSTGKFKETVFGSWVEAILNLIISIIFVYKFGLVGVAVGTLISVLIRTIELIIFSSKHILYCSCFSSFKSIIVSFFSILLSFYIVNQLLVYDINNFVLFFISGFIVVLVSCFILLLLSLVFEKNNLHKLFKHFRNLYRHRR